MHLTPSDPDIATLYRKILHNRLDLQPNFQRGEVWGKAKKQRLIDSILRGWHIPPVHVIQVPNSEKQEVLDGQQRLAAIRDFIEGVYPINGNLDPVDPKIMALDGFYWNDLPDELSASIEDFTIRVLTISDFLPGEPGELFYRLNQPTNLTSAEQRNAYFGEARQQVKNLSEYMADLGFRRENLGFSNSRMAYDDIISKFLITIENKTLKQKITANTVTARYRDSGGFDGSVIDSAEQALRVFMRCISSFESSVKLNKASALSWLVFLYVYIKKGGGEKRLINFFRYFEGLKSGSKIKLDDEDVPSGFSREFLRKMLAVYLDRSSARVADVSSVILRDVSLWGFFVINNHESISGSKKLKRLYESIHHLATLKPSSVTEANFEQVAIDVGWGGLNE